MNKEFLKMQKLAGIITEGQYTKKLNENPSSGKSYKDLLDIAKQYEGDEDYVGSFKKAFQGKNTITKAEWEEWSRTLDGGYDPENYAEKNWRMAGKNLNEAINDLDIVDQVISQTPYPVTDLESLRHEMEYSDLIQSVAEKMGNDHDRAVEALEEWGYDEFGGE